MVNDDPIDSLERELVAAARRAAPPVCASDDAPRPNGRARVAWRRGLIAAAVLVPVILVVAVALLIGSGSSSTSPSVTAAGTSPQTVLAVLRHPGTAPTGQGLSVIERTARTVSDPTVSVQRRLLRQVPVTVAAGATDELDLVVVKAADGRRLIGLTVPSSGKSGTSLMYAYSSQTSQAYATVDQLESGGVSTWLGEGPSNTQDYAVLVPDGVARVRLDAPGHPTATVHHNVAGFRLANASPDALSKQLAMTWLNASGRVIHRVTGASLPSVAQLRTRVDAAVATLHAHLAVLSRPETADDRAERKLIRHVGFPGMTVVASSARIARTSRSTGPVILALVRETSEGTAGVLVFDKDGGGPVDVTQLLREGGTTSTSPRGGAGETTILVPDGVHAVALTAHGTTTRATVRNNVAILAGTYPGLTTSTSWYGAHGQLIKRIPAPGRTSAGD